LKRIPVAAVTSVNVTGDVAWGLAGGGVFGKAGALYDRPVRSGVDVGDGAGCWQNTDVGDKSSNNGNNRREIDGKRPARFNPGGVLGLRSTGWLVPDTALTRSLIVRSKVT